MKRPAPVAERPAPELIVLTGYDGARLSRWTPPGLVTALVPAECSLSAAQGVLVGAALGSLSWSLMLLAVAALYLGIG